MCVCVRCHFDDGGLAVKVDGSFFIFFFIPTFGNNPVRRHRKRLNNVFKKDMYISATSVLHYEEAKSSNLLSVIGITSTPTHYEIKFLS